MRKLLRTHLVFLMGLGSLACGAQSVAQAQKLPRSHTSTKAPAQDAQLIGPMVGALTMRAARVWAQVQASTLNNARAWIEYMPVAGASGGSQLRQVSDVKQLSKDDHGTAAWVLSGLEPGTSYQYQVHWRVGKTAGVSKSLTFRTETLWQYRKDPPAIRILASSCAYTNEVSDDRPGRPYGQSNEIFRSMAQRQPDINLWMGDNVYFREPDFDDAAAMAKRYDRWRALPEMQPLLQTGSHLAIWDDHDFGPNDSNSAYTFKDVSLALFQRYWANPSYGVPGAPGVFTRQNSSDVEFIFLDSRWYRDSDKLIDEDRQMLGEAQLRWLKNTLLASTATWKFVVNGSQMLNLNNRFEGWHKFPRESQQFLDWLEKQSIPGVMLLSGDRHFSTLLKLERPNTYPLYELTCSPTTAGPYTNPAADLTDNARIVPGSTVTKNNFCELEITGERGKRSLNMSIRGVDGGLLWSQRIDESGLR
jgi:alkaline phosphatase D